jgi:hypothetical protein
VISKRFGLFGMDLHPLPYTQIQNQHMNMQSGYNIIQAHQIKGGLLCICYQFLMNLEGKNIMSEEDKETIKKLVKEAAERAEKDKERLLKNLKKAAREEKADE